jgi:hypothetical protein
VILNLGEERKSGDFEKKVYGYRISKTRELAQAVSSWPVTKKARVHSA